MVAPDGRGRSSVAQGVTGLEHQRKSYTVRQVEEFWVSDKSGHCCQIPQRMERYCFLREEFDGRKTGERLRSLGFPLKVGVGNDAPAFNTTDLAGLVFFF